ncbi:uncharacterized protein CIMG_06068 [Coccidioides immitis RS]|uniref:DUF300-domain-containing protein n=3 Tax=Coccidioides immitis TaxID=5501 RepID=A0A0E1RXA4_COCIM|nr:uncharacterized protein CIMG_06068 [Coccidioides immitis RS]EAS30589.2 hypothetical protein CIMG_06068 [Coccidioides immitis RS]KMP03141.1 hypothetical protein CIRG_02833 [Coccidioides immitis RMSCC 2394]KMU79216.1 hypothetical protein CISG_07647 [Coccidioides immitis RMSCC 3703]TPX23523.1 hypothetical protein DIZ76_012857 [Coccidioides immitis]
MGWPVCNETLQAERVSEVPLWDGGITFHQLGLIISATFSLIAVLVSVYLVFQHAVHYLRPQEQRHIIRILFMVPIYAVVSFLSFYHYRHTVYFQVLRDCYEAFAISAFFSLMCHYIADDLHKQKEYFRGIVPKPWYWPLDWFQKCCGGERGIWRTPRSGLTWFNIIWTGVFQYCFIRVAMTIVAVVTQKFHVYCAESLSPAFAHLWVMVIEVICVTVAMYCLIQFYIQLKEDLTPHSPFMKILAIKLVIFLSFWQEITISFLTSSGAIKTSSQMGLPDIKLGIPSTLLCVEMAAFAILHLWAFPWKQYSLINSKHTNAPEDDFDAPRMESYQGGFLGIKALIDAFNPWDLIKAIGRSARWLFVGRKHRQFDPSYQGQPGSSFTVKTPAVRMQEQGTAYLGAQSGDEMMMMQPASRQYDSYGGERDELLANAQDNPVTDYPPHTLKRTGSQ